MKKIIQNIKWFFRQCKRSFGYAKRAWGGYDWDYQYSVDIFMYSLERLANNLDSDKAYSVNATRDAKQIRRVLNLMKKVYNEDFSHECYDKLKALYGDNVLDFCTNRSVRGAFYEYETWSNAAEINEVYKKLIHESHEKQEKAHALVWRLINNHIRYWWD
jgi:hypothetical protein